MTGMELNDIDDLPNEVWVDVAGYETGYRISTLFRVKSKNRVIEQKRGSLVFKAAQLIKQHPNQDGYLQVRLTKERNSKTLCVHILMAKSFNLPNPNNLPELNHNDGNKLNCALGNLIWSSHADNMKHAVKNGLRVYKKGGVSKRLKLTKEQILEIYNSKELTGIVAKRYGLTKSSIQRIKSGETYSSITVRDGEIGKCYHKLTDDIAKEIRDSKLLQREICKKYKVSKGLVYNIKNKISYAWI